MRDFHKPNCSNNLISKRMSSIIKNAGYDENVALVVTNLFTYMVKNKFFGGCHALSSALYVALSEIGLKPILCIGQCARDGLAPYDHSWVELDGKIIDVAIYMPMTQLIGSVSGPVILDTDTLTMRQNETQYGVDTGLPLDAETETVLNIPFGDYMKYFPNESGGLWTVVKKIMPANKIFDCPVSTGKYQNVSRNLIVRKLK